MKAGVLRVLRMLLGQGTGLVAQDSEHTPASFLLVGVRTARGSERPWPGLGVVSAPGKSPPR